MSGPYVSVAPGESLTAVLSGAHSTVAPNFMVTWEQDDPDPGFVNSVPGLLTGTTPVTLLRGADGPYSRSVHSVRVNNRDSAAVTVSLAKVVSGVSYVLHAVTLQAGDMLSLDWAGPIVVNANGQTKSTTD